MNWATIPDSHYEISRDGQVRNMETGWILKFEIRKNGYYQYRIKRKNYFLHRLLANAFIPNPDNKEYVDHINRDKSDNRLENLRWATSAENSHNRTIQTRKKIQMKHIDRSRDCCYRVQVVRNGEQYLEYFSTLQDAVEARDLILSLYQDATKA